MEYSKYFKHFLLLSLGIFLAYTFIINRYTAILKTIRLPFKLSPRRSNVSLNSISLINQSNNSIFEYSSIVRPSIEFKSRLSRYYPHLPIHIFTQNLSLVDNASKLILLGNGFFGDRHWGIAPPGQSSTTKSNKHIY
mgnify:CR=1 FL=1